MMIRRHQDLSDWDHTMSAARPAPEPADLWIARTLKRSYDQTLAEPVPDDLLRLVARFPAAS